MLHLAAMDIAGNLYVTDKNNKCIRKLSSGYGTRGVLAPVQVKARASNFDGAIGFENYFQFAQLFVTTIE